MDGTENTDTLIIAKCEACRVIDAFLFVSDFQNMPGTMRPSAPRPQAFGAMRPPSQMPRMMSTQRVGQSLVV